MALKAKGDIAITLPYKVNAVIDSSLQTIQTSQHEAQRVYIRNPSLHPVNMNYIPLETKRKSNFDNLINSSKKRRRMKPLSFGGDNRILHRIKELMVVSPIIDEDQLLSDLQDTYPEYRRKRRGDLKGAIRKAVALFSVDGRNSDESGSAQGFGNDVKFSPDEKEKYVAYEDVRLQEKTRLNKNKEYIQVKEVASTRSEHVRNDGNNGDVHSPVMFVVDKNPGILKNSTQGSNMKDLKVQKSQNIPRNLKKQESKGPILQYPTVTFADIGGQEAILEEIYELLIHLRFPKIFSSSGAKHSPGGILLHGPPGCGKTLLAHAIAGEVKFPLIEVAAADLISGISGDSEDKIRNVFDQAVSSSPCILFFDEIDAIAPKREFTSRGMEKRVVSQLLKCMDDLRTRYVDSKVLVIGATNTPDALDPAFRRGGRFDEEIGIGIPDETTRIGILQVVCKDLRLSPDFDLCWLANRTPGYVGADLAALVTGAVKKACRRMVKKLCALLESDNVLHKRLLELMKEAGLQVDSITEVPKEFLNTKKATLVKLHAVVSMSDSEADPLIEKLIEEFHISTEDFLAVLCLCGGSTSSWMCEAKVQDAGLQFGDSHVCRLLYADDTILLSEGESEATLDTYVPCCKREGFATVPSVPWQRVGGLEKIKEEFQKAILWPLKHKEACGIFKYDPPSGMLLWGPKGCGKTLLAKAVASECGINFIPVKGPELLNMYVGESERAVRKVFQRARNSAPCVVLFDELDSLCPPRSNSSGNASADRVVNQLLSEMDGMEPKTKIFIIGTTNRLENIDSAMLRPGRLEKILYVGLPAPEERVDILKAITKNGTDPKLADDVNLETLGLDHRCNGFSGADLESLLRTVSSKALQDFISGNVIDINLSNGIIPLAYFDSAFSEIKPSVSQEEREYFESMRLSQEGND